MKRQEKNEIYSIRKFKVGVGSALIGLSFLGATGLVNDIPVIGDVFGVDQVKAESDSNGISYKSVPAYDQNGNYYGNVEIEYRAGGWNLRTTLREGYSIISVREFNVVLYYKSYVNVGGSSSGSSGNDNWRNDVGGDGSQPGGSNSSSSSDSRVSKTINVRYNVVNKNSSDVYNFNTVVVPVTRSSSGQWSYVISAPEGFVLAKNNQTTSTENSSTEPSDSIVVDIKKKVDTRYQGDDNFDLGYESSVTHDGVTIVTKGTKPTVTKRTINFKTRYVKDETREKGAENITETEGRNGEVTTTVGHEVHGIIGTVRDLPPQESETPVVDKVVKVAAKDKVVYSKKGNDVIKSTTVYTVNPDTGDITEKTTDVVFKANGAKDTVVTTPIPSPKRYEKDDKREKGAENIETKGVEGVSSVTTTYTVNPQTGDTTGTPGPSVVTKKPTETVIKVAAKDKVVTTKIPSPKRYEADTTKDYGTQNVETKGTDGSDVSTTVYTVNSTDGTITENTTKQHTDAIPTIVKVGAKTKVETKIDDQGRTVTETTTYTVNPDTGDVTPNKTTSYGDKESTVEKKVVPSPKRYEKDATREKGDKDIVIKGKDGEDQITTTYVVDPTTGNITPNVGEAVHTIEPTETVIKVAAKDKVDIITRDGKKFKVTTTYNVNSKTGKITEDRTEVELPKEEDPQDDAGVNGNKLPDKVETIKPEVVYEKDATRDKGSENITIPGKDGQKVTPVTKEKDPQTGKLVEKLGEPKITPAINTIVKVAAKDKVETKEIPSKVRYVGDETKDNGSEPVRTEGKKGKEVTTITYSVNSKTGEITDSKKTERTEEPTDTVVTIGTKPTVVTKKDDQGRTVTKTTTYTVNPETGEVTTSTTISYGDKESTVKKTVVPSPKRYEKDATREKGAENIVVKGKDGEDQITTTYSVDPTSGKVIQNIGEPVRTVEPTETVIKVAAKDKVETFRHNGDTIERTTRYTVNPETGEITEETIEQLISSNGNGVKPPVVENNDFSGGVSTEPLVNEKLDYKGVIAGNGLDNDGNAIKPPIVTIPEFSGGVNGDVDGNALINEKPAFDVSTLKKPDLGTGLNDFGPKKETKKDDLQFIPVNEEKPSNDFKRSEKPVNELPNTAGGNNMAINVLGALTLTSVLGLAATKRKKEDN